MTEKMRTHTQPYVHTGPIDANVLEALAKQRPGEILLNSQGILTLLGGIRQLEAEIRQLKAAPQAEPQQPQVEAGADGCECANCANGMGQCQTMSNVCKGDANNYCLILRALGMEEDGDPVAEVIRMVAAQGGQEVEPAVLSAPLRLVVKKLARFEECAEDSDSGGCDIGRSWFDVLTLLGLLERTQRSPAEWTMTPAGHDLLRTGGLAHRSSHQGDAELLDFIERHRVLVSPEYEGPWEARVYGDNEKPFVTGVGKTPRASIVDAIAHQGRKAGA